MFRGSSTTGDGAIGIDAAATDIDLDSQSSIDLASSTSPTSNTTIDSFDLRRAAVMNSTRVAKNAGRQSAREVVEGGIEGLITALREGTEALRLILLPKRQLAELLRTKPFEKIDRLNRREAAKELRKIGVAEINYFLGKDTED